ncbi:MAG: 1-acyl-sn-glycerol-3-phosphate acyltransferase [Acidobacteriota bacterium]|nr:1-acyl-sn-glycerol-3-phosphate acyltransferase [Acidobacteriota bacterium]
MTQPKRRLTFDAPRELLLLEIARRCRACDVAARIGLTKQEARDYVGFECEACSEWNEDELAERDVPEWWEELRVTGLDTLRARADDHSDVEEGPEAVKRLSESWRVSSERRFVAPIAAPTEESYVLPQWAIQLVRAALFKLFRVFFRLRLSGVENVPREGGLIIASNHQTYFDPFWVGSPVKRPLRFLAWDAVLGWFMIGRLMGWLGAWPLRTKQGDTRTYRRSVQWLRSGGALVIFPEGGRARADGALQPFKPGAARLALEADVPVVPVTIRGGNRVWPKDRTRPRLARVEIIYHPARRFAPLPGEDTRACARRESEQLYETINSAL